MTQQKILTIAIPTFNRAELLEKNLKLVANTLPNGIHLLIIDNASDKKVEFDEHLISLLDRNNVTFRIIRNCQNIGGGANILRCFEYVETDWFLLCGDDDIINSNYIEDIKILIEKHHDCGFIKLSSKFHSYSDAILDKGVCALMRAPGDFNSLLFMSSFVFNRKLCLTNLRFGYLMTGAYAPHVAIALLTSKNHPFVLSPIMATIANEDEPAWSPTDVVLCSYYLSDIPLSTDERTAVTRKIYNSHNIGREILDVVSIYNLPGMSEEARFIRRKALRVHLFFGHGFKRAVALALLLFAPFFGTFGQKILSREYEKSSGRRYSRSFTNRHAGL